MAYQHRPPVQSYGQPPNDTDDSTIDFASLKSFERNVDEVQNSRMPLPTNASADYQRCRQGCCANCSRDDRGGSDRGGSSMSGSLTSDVILGPRSYLNYWSPTQIYTTPATSCPSINLQSKAPQAPPEVERNFPESHAFAYSDTTSVTAREIGNNMREDGSVSQASSYVDEVARSQMGPSSYPDSQDYVRSQTLRAQMSPKRTATGKKRGRQEDASVSHSSKRQDTRQSSNQDDNIFRTSLQASQPTDPIAILGSMRHGLDATGRGILNLWLDKRLGNPLAGHKISMKRSKLLSLCDAVDADEKTVVSYLRSRYQSLLRPDLSQASFSLSHLSQSSSTQASGSQYNCFHRPGPTLPSLGQPGHIQVDTSQADLDFPRAGEFDQMMAVPPVAPVASGAAANTFGDIARIAKDTADAAAAATSHAFGRCNTTAEHKKHVGGYECPTCGAHFDSIEAWKRHCKQQRWPPLYCRCTGCGKVFRKPHVMDHVRKVCRKDNPDAESYELEYDPADWTQNCEFCGERFNGKRSEGTMILIQHIWDNHMKPCRGSDWPVDDPEDDSGADSSHGDNEDEGNDNRENPAPDNGQYEPAPPSQGFHDLYDGMSGNNIWGQNDDYDFDQQGQWRRSRIRGVSRGRTHDRLTSYVRSIKPISIGRGCEPPEDDDSDLCLFDIEEAADEQNKDEVTQTEVKSQTARGPSITSSSTRSAQTVVPPRGHPEFTMSRSTTIISTTSDTWSEPAGGIDDYYSASEDDDCDADGEDSICGESNTVSVLEATSADDRRAARPFGRAPSSGFSALVVPFHMYGQPQTTSMRTPELPSSLMESQSTSSPYEATPTSTKQTRVTFDLPLRQSGQRHQSQVCVNESESSPGLRRASG